MNTNIKEYLKEYINRNDKDVYATLLTGEWGCGKTYFIKNFIKEMNQESHQIDTTNFPSLSLNPNFSYTPQEKMMLPNKYKFIYVSLFGLKTLEEVNEAIFQEMHPILSSVPVKFIGKMVNVASKFLIPIVGDNQITIDMNLSITELFKQYQQKNIVFIFDDLERTLIRAEEILGFINSITEQSGMKCIVVANEEEVIKKDTDLEIFNTFKEKVIAKTFEVKNEENKYWDDYKTNNHLYFTQEQFDIIRNINSKYKNKNFRCLNQTTNDFILFKSKIDLQFYENKEFQNILTEQFFTISLNYLKNNNFSKTFSELLKSSILPYLFEEDVWKIIITDFYSDSNKLNKIISELSLFDNKDQNWINLWHYQVLDEDEFKFYLDKVTNEFFNLQYDKPEKVIHVVNMLILFIKSNILKDISIEYIKNTIDKYIYKYGDKKYWIGFYPSSSLGNGTGYGYINTDDHDVKKMGNYIYNSLKENKIKQEENHAIKSLGELFNAINDENKTLIKSIIKNNPPTFIKYTAIAETEEFNKIINHPNKLQLLFYIFGDRYRDNSYINDENNIDRSTYEYFKDELPFLKYIKNKLNKKLNENLSAFLLLRYKELQKDLDELIKKFEEKNTFND